jgi:hypothetical protein
MAIERASDHHFYIHSLYHRFLFASLSTSTSTSLPQKKKLIDRHCHVMFAVRGI